MSGLVGVIAQETARFSMFGASLGGLDRPEGSSEKWQFGHDIADNANMLVHEMYRQEKDWLWLLGDDHSFSPGLLLKLLAREVEIVQPLCLQRNPPYRPTAYADEGVRLDLDDHPDGGLVPVWACGSGGTLFRRSVFDAVGEPWFEGGAAGPGQVGEDVRFIRKAAEKGVRAYVDLDAPLGHCTTSVVWPVREADGWTFGFSMMGGFQITMPPGSSWVYADGKARSA